MHDPLTLRAALSDAHLHLVGCLAAVDACNPVPDTLAGGRVLLHYTSELLVARGLLLRHPDRAPGQYEDEIREAWRVYGPANDLAMRLICGDVAVDAAKTANTPTQPASEPELEPDVIIGAAGPEQVARLARITALAADRGWHVWPALQPEVATICIDDRPDWSGDDSEWRGFVGCEVDLRTGAVTPSIEACGTEQVAEVAELMCDLGAMASALASEVVSGPRTEAPSPPRPLAAWAHGLRLELEPPKGPWPVWPDAEWVDAIIGSKLGAPSAVDLSHDREDGLCFDFGYDLPDTSFSVVFSCHPKRRRGVFIYERMAPVCWSPTEARALLDAIADGGGWVTPEEMLASCVAPESRGKVPAHGEAMGKSLDEVEALAIDASVPS